MENFKVSVDLDIHSFNGQVEIWARGKPQDRFCEVEMMCPICGDFTIEPCFLRHLYEHQSNGQLANIPESITLKCIHCSGSYKNKPSFRSHISRTKKGCEPKVEKTVHRCNLCLREFARKANLDYHLACIDKFGICPIDYRANKSKVS